MNSSSMRDNKLLSHDGMVAVHFLENVTQYPAEAPLPDEGAWLEIPREIQITRATILVASALVGIPANLCLLFTITCSRFLRSDKDNVMVFHMAAVSLFSCGVLLPVHGATLAMGRWGMGEAACQAAGYLFSLNNQVIIWTIVFITTNRYRLIARPLRCTNAVSFSSLGPWFIVLWVAAALSSAVPYIMGERYTYDLLDGACVPHSDRNMAVYPYIWILVMVLTFYIPPGIVGLCYYHVFQISRRQSRRLSALVHLVTMTTHTVTPSAVMRKTSHASLLGRKAPKTVAKYLGSFLACYIPYCVVILVEAIWGQDVERGKAFIGGFRVIASTLIHVSPAVHSYMYGIKNQLMWETFVYHVRRKVLNPGLSRNSHQLRRTQAIRPPLIIVSRHSRSGPSSAAVRNNLSLPDLNSPVTNGLLAVENNVPRAHSLDMVVPGELV